MAQEMMNLFAIPVFKSSIGREFNEAELQFFRDELKDAVPALNNYSSRNKNVLASEAMMHIKSIIQDNLDHYFKSVYNTSNKVQLKITQSWLSATQKGQSHHTHSHPNSVVSGVLYINLAPQDGINFYRNEDLLWYELIPQEQNYYNAHRYFIETKVGDLVLFPSSVKHGVKEVTEDIDRISLAFNTFFEGELGKESFSNSLTVKIE
ncbi:MAG: 2OG-Fe(II) oxygenase family protein [Gammaproteobacteria bacterium]|nr:2OG-Fe(II) oxygenase family protein [Gammaproteobacteria bacterium]